MSAIQGSQELGSMALSSTNTTTYISAYSSNLGAIGKFTLSIPTGLTITVSITHDREVGASSEWVVVGTGLAGQQEYTYATGSCMGVRLVWVSGSGNVKGEITEFAGGGGGTATAPSYTQDVSVPRYENNADEVAQTMDAPTASATGATIMDVSTALEASSVTKASSGKFYDIKGFIDSTATGAPTMYYLHVVNSATVPPDGAVTHLIAPIPIKHTNGTPSPFSVEFKRGVYATNGICWYISSTQFTKTITTAIASATACAY